MKENSTIEIGFTKFCSLRPANVLLYADMPRDVCLCQYHENIKMLCKVLYKEISNFPLYSGSFANKFVYSHDSELCMFGNCRKCPKWVWLLRGEADFQDDLTTRYQWEHVEQKVQVEKGKKLKKVKRMQNVCKKGTVSDAINALQSQMPFLGGHANVRPM